MAIKNFMRTFIKLTDYSDDSDVGYFYISPETITTMIGTADHTQIETMVGTREEKTLFSVKESVEEIADIVEKHLQDLNELDEANFDKQQEVLLRRAKKNLETQKSVKELQALEAKLN